MTPEMPPHSSVAERNLIACVLRDPLVLNEIREEFDPNSFWEDASQKIYAVVLDLYDARKPIELASVAVELERRKQLEDVGGTHYLADLWQHQATGHNAGYYGRIVRDRWLQRSLIHVGTEILRDAYGAGKADDMLDEAERKILALSNLGVSGAVKHVAEFVNESFARIDSPLDENLPEGVTGLPMGFRDLDHLTSGLHPSELVIVAARTSVGKTAIAGNVVGNTVLAGGRVFVASLEQPGRELIDRLLCGFGLVDATQVRQRTLTTIEKERFYKAGDKFRESALWIDDTPAQSARRIMANARRLHARGELDLVVVDYLQRVKASDTRLPRHEQIGLVTGDMKQLARELKCPVLLLCQINREAENKTDTKPRLHNLKGSGDIEQDADTVIILHRPKPTEPFVEAEVAKQRNGPTGEVVLRYENVYLRFVDCDQPNRL